MAQTVDMHRRTAARVIRSNVAAQSRVQRASGYATWDLPGKVRRGREIGDEVRRRHAGHHNDAEDAQRHAEWSKQMADELGPGFATFAGGEHEIENLMGGGPISESVMDMTNNLEGIGASRQGRAIDPARLQTSPISGRAAAAQAENRYEDRSPDQTSYPSRPYGAQGSFRKGYKDARRSDPSSRYPAY